MVAAKAVIDWDNAGLQFACVAGEITALVDALLVGARIAEEAKARDGFERLKSIVSEAIGRPNGRPATRSEVRLALIAMLKHWAERAEASNP